MTSSSCEWSYHSRWILYVIGHMTVTAHEIHIHLFYTINMARYTEVMWCVCFFLHTYFISFVPKKGNFHGDAITVVRVLDNVSSINSNSSLLKTWMLEEFQVVSTNSWVYFDSVEFYWHLLFCVWMQRSTADVLCPVSCPFFRSVSTH